MGGLAGLFAGAEGAGAAGAAGAAGSEAAMSGVAGMTAEQAATQAAAQQALAQGAGNTAGMNTLFSAGSLDPQGMNALQQGFMESMFPNQWNPPQMTQSPWSTNEWGATLDPARTDARNALSNWAAEDTARAIEFVGGPRNQAWADWVRKYDRTSPEMAQWIMSERANPTNAPVSVGLVGAEGAGRPNPVGQALKSWFMQSSPIGRFVKGRLDARQALQGGLFGQGGVDTQVPSYLDALKDNPNKEALQDPELQALLAQLLQRVRGGH